MNWKAFQEFKEEVRKLGFSEPRDFNEARTLLSKISVAVRKKEGKNKAVETTSHLTDLLAMFHSGRQQKTAFRPQVYKKPRRPGRNEMKVLVRKTDGTIEEYPSMIALSRKCGKADSFIGMIRQGRLRTISKDCYIAGCSIKIGDMDWIDITDIQIDDLYIIRYGHKATEKRI